jgi:hypothetical protein
MELRELGTGTFLGASRDYFWWIGSNLGAYVKKISNYFILRVNMDGFQLTDQHRQLWV